MKGIKRTPAILMASFLLLFILTGCTGQPAAPEQAAPAERTVTDMAGRTVTLPAEIETVFSASPTTAIYLYTLIPERLLGWNYDLNAVERNIILKEYSDLPNFGMGDAVNYEAVIAANPTIAVSVTAINDGTIDQSDRLSEKIGIPVVTVSDRLEDAPDVYIFLGELFGVQERAGELSAYAKKTINDISCMDIPDHKNVRVYYGNGEDSLETAPAGSSHGQILDMVNAENVACLELGEGSRVRISPEQLLAWDPDVIIVNGEPKSDMSGSMAAEAILGNSNYADLKAVKSNRVFGTPNAPFSWMDRPPGPNRIVGLRWLAKKIYPDYFDYDVDDEVREFFRLFYHIELTDEQLYNIYSGNMI